MMPFVVGIKREGSSKIWIVFQGDPAERRKPRTPQMSPQWDKEITEKGSIMHTKRNKFQFGICRYVKMYE
jgi:hypothetical protein